MKKITERVKCYKVGLGLLMEQNVKSIKLIMDKLLLNSLKIVEEHKLTNDKIMKKNTEAVNDILEDKNFYERKTKELLQYCELLKEQKEFMANNLDAIKLEVE